MTMQRTAPGAHRLGPRAETGGIRSRAALLPPSLRQPDAPAGAADEGSGGTELQATLANGLRVVIASNSLAPVVAIQLSYLVGANETPTGFPGMAHALEHMMFRGTTDLSADQLARLIALTGGVANAETRQTVTQYFFTIPADQIEIPLRIEASRMRDLLISEILWQQERRVLQQEVGRHLSGPWHRIHTRLLARLFAGTPYAHDGLGTRSSFERTTVAMLEGFYRDWYAPNNAVLVIAGDVDPDRTLGTVRRHFEAIHARPVPPRPSIHLRRAPAAAFHAEAGLPVGQIVIAHRMPGSHSANFPAVQVLADVLNSPRGVLRRLVLDGQALEADFFLEAHPAVSLGYAVLAFPRGGDGNGLAARAARAMADTGRSRLFVELVEAAKRRGQGEAERRHTSIAGLAEAWSQALAVDGHASPAEAAGALQRVGAADVERVAHVALHPETATVAILTPRSGRGVTRCRPVRSIESPAPVRPGAAAPLPTWADTATRLPEPPASRVDPAVFTLSNGLHLLVQPETLGRSVSVRGSVKSDPTLQEPAGKEGVDAVLDGLLEYGAGHRSREEYLHELDAIGAELSVGRRFSLEVLAEHFDRGMSLLADALLTPAFPEAGFRVVRERVRALVAGRLATPAYQAERALLTGLFPTGDPVQREATPGSVAGLTLADVQAYHQSVFRPDLTTIVVIGAIAPARAREAMDRILGGWIAAGPRPVTDLPPVPLNAAGRIGVRDPGRVQVRATLAETLGITRGHSDYYPLVVGQYVLAGGFYASRLYRDLRGERGLVYHVDAGLDAGTTRTVFRVGYGTDPDKVEAAGRLIAEDLRMMGTTPVEGPELTQAKILLLRQMPLAESSLASIAAGLLGRSERGLPLDEPTRAAPRILEITPEEVRAAFARWIRPEDFVQVNLGPV